MRMRLVSLLVPACAALAFAADYRVLLTPENTKVQFTVPDVLHTVHGTFLLKNGNIEFNSETGKASGEIVIDVASGNSGSEARDSKMHANVLESKKYPVAVFAPDRVDGTLAAAGNSSLKVHGMFTIHGAAHEMTMDVQTTTAGDKIHATIAFMIPYVAWGMKDPSNFLLKVSKSVQMTIDASGELQKR